MNVEGLLGRASKLDDPLERAQYLNDHVLPAVTELRQDIIAQRALSVKEACDFGNGGDGLTYSQVARSLAVSKPLVQQMVSLAREIHTLRVRRNGSL
tara:strand:+ start:18755 stop:19045 length:291 start_codon:yes stop_codon:yes gene_type:complete